MEPRRVFVDQADRPPVQFPTPSGGKKGVDGVPLERVRIITGLVASWGDHSTSPARTAGSMAGLGLLTPAASPNSAKGTRVFTTATISRSERVSWGRTAS